MKTFSIFSDKSLAYALGFYLLTPLSYAQMLQPGVVTDGESTCTLMTSCTGTNSSTSLILDSANTNNFGLTINMLGICDTDSTQCETTEDEMSIIVTKDAEVNSTYNIMYQFNPQVCPEDVGDYDILVVCGEDAFFKHYFLSPVISEVTCAAEAISNGQREYSISWAMSGCLREQGVIVTLENAVGLSEQRSSTADQLSMDITSSITDLRYVTVAPMNNPSGDDAVVMACTGLEESTVTPMPGGVIYKVKTFDETPPNGQIRIPFTAPMAGSRLSMATKLMQSNSKFLGLSDSGIPLYDESGVPLYEDMTLLESGICTSGTELQQKEGIGSGQPDNGNIATNDVDVIGNVRFDSNPFMTLSDDTAEVHIMRVANTTDFELIVTNKGYRIPGNNNCTGFDVTYAPGLIVVHGGSEKVLYTEGAPDYGDGLEELAENGDPETLATTLRARISAAGSSAAQLSTIIGFAVFMMTQFY